MPNWTDIRKEWETSKITLKALAEKHNVKLGTLKSRKSRESWSRDATFKKDATKNEKVATVKDASKKRKATSNKQKNRSGNPNPTHRFPNHNSFQLKHGLYSKFLHEEQIEIIDIMKDSSIADQLWMQIEIKFSAIIRMQKIMNVNNSHDTLSELQSTSEGMEGSAESYKVVYAFEQYESYIKAQTRAMAEYRNLVKQFLEMAHDEDERKLKLELMQSNINKIKAETKNEEKQATNITIIDEWADNDAN